MFPATARRMLARVGSSVGGVMGNEYISDDWEVERDTRVEANGVVAREDTVLACLRERSPSEPGSW